MSFCLGFLFVFFFSSLESFYSLSYDSAFLMFVVYRNKHAKVAFLLDVGNFGHCSGSSHDTWPGERHMNDSLIFSLETFF